jgi:hypothetical protein
MVADLASAAIDGCHGRGKGGRDVAVGLARACQREMRQLRGCCKKMRHDTTLL